MRLDRFLTLHVFKHLTRILPHPKGMHIPILMYHSISDEPEKGHPYFWINTFPKRFAEHMKFLYENNYKVINLSEAARLIEHVPMQPNKLNKPKKLYKQRKYVVLTFDDGYRDFYTHAFPGLREYGFSATVFLPTSFIDNRREPGLKGKEHLSWSEIVELEREGVAFGSHTVTHSQLRFLRNDEIEREVKQSKDIIEDKIGEPVDSFSYPFAFPEDREFKKYLGETLEKFGYKNGVSTRIGTVKNGEDRFFLKRIPINTLDDIVFLKAKLQGSYDWLYEPQCFFKRIKNKLNHDEQKGK